MQRREHWGPCLVNRFEPMRATYSVKFGGTYPTMEGAIDQLDPFQAHVHWPLHNVGDYLGRMGVGQ